MLLPSDIIINSGRKMNGRDVNFVIRKYRLEGFFPKLKHYEILIHNPWFVVPPNYEPDYVFGIPESLGSLEFYVRNVSILIRDKKLHIDNFIMRPENDTVSSQKDKIKLFKGLGRLMLCCLTHFLLEKKEVNVESTVIWHTFSGSGYSNVSGDYAMSDEDDVSRIKLLEEIWSKFGFVKVLSDVDVDESVWSVRSTVRDIQLNCINEFARQTAFGRDDSSARRYATIASLTRLRDELYARQAKRAKKGGKWEGEEEYEEEEKGVLEGRRAFDVIHSDDLWRHILEFV